MKRAFIGILFLSALAAYAASALHGKDRLRELVVLPTINLQMSFQFNSRFTDLFEEDELSEAAEAQRAELKLHPDDPVGQLRLGRLLDRLGKTNESDLCFKEAEKIARRISGERPRDAGVMVTLGEAVGGLGRTAEAESLYRHALLISSNEWRGWINLGTLQIKQSLDLLAPADSVASPAAAAVALRNHPPPANAVAESTALRKEAIACFDRAVAVAPRQPDVYFERAGFQSAAKMQASLIDILHGATNNASSLAQVLLTPDALPDMRQAARLCPDNYRVLRAALYYEIMVYRTRSGQISADVFPLDSVPQDSSRFIRETLARLQALADGPDQRKAAGALESLSFIELMLGHEETARSQAKRAIALDPHRERAWNVLMGLAGSAGEKITLAEARLKARDCSFNHLLLSKALTGAAKWDRAATETEAAVKGDPNNISAEMMVAALAIRRVPEPAAVNTATNHLAKVQQLLAAAPPSDETRDRFRVTILNLVILAALGDDPDTAKELLNQFSHQFPDDETAKEIRQAMP